MLCFLTGKIYLKSASNAPRILIVCISYTCIFILCHLFADFRIIVDANCTHKHEKNLLCFQSLMNVDKYSLLALSK